MNANLVKMIFITIARVCHDFNPALMIMMVTESLPVLLVDQKMCRARGGEDRLGLKTTTMQV